MQAALDWLEKNLEGIVRGLADLVAIESISTDGEHTTEIERTAKLTVEERQGIPHHLLDVWDVRVTATAAAYQDLARTTISGLLSRGVTPVVVGGSGLYLRAALDVMDFPGTDPVLRADLESQLAAVGSGPLHARLTTLDPEAANQMEPSNGRRVVRALEVVLLTGRMPGALTEYVEHLPTTYVGVDRPDLAERVATRVGRMWEHGLLDEVAGLDGLREGVTSSRALGYAQALAQLDGELTESEAKARTVTATRRFVRRQRSWFRRDPRIAWLDPDRDLLDQARGLVGTSD